MNEKDKELIREVSNSEFPLDAFANDIEHLRFLQPGNQALEAYDFDFMEEDIIKMAKTFKHFLDESKKRHGKYVEESVCKADAFKETNNVLKKAEAFDILRKRIGIMLSEESHSIAVYRESACLEPNEEETVREALS